MDKWRVKLHLIKKNIYTTKREKLQTTPLSLSTACGDGEEEVKKDAGGRQQKEGSTAYFFQDAFDRYSLTRSLPVGSSLSLFLSLAIPLALSFTLFSSHIAPSLVLLLCSHHCDLQIRGKKLLHQFFQLPSCS